MAHKQSIGRKASDEARDAARALVDMYKPVLADPTGCLCLNPEEAPEDQIFVTHDDAARAMLGALERLAETGWLVEIKVSLEKFLIRADYAAIKREHSKTKDALLVLSDKHPRSTRDLQRMVGNDKR